MNGKLGEMTQRLAPGKAQKGVYTVVASTTYLFGVDGDAEHEELLLSIDLLPNVPEEEE